MENSVKVLHTADFHLGASRVGVRNGKSEIENTLQKLISVCKDKAVDFLLIAGDLFDSPFVDDPYAKKIAALFARIPNTTIAIATGNHDPFCAGSVYAKNEFPENVVVFGGELKYIDFPEKGVRLWGAGFSERYTYSPLLTNDKHDDKDFIQLCVLHGELTSEGSECVYNPIYQSQIENCGFDYLALGHIHKRTEIKKLGNTHFSYCGCPDGKGFDEIGSLGVYIGTISKENCNMEYYETSSRKYIIDNIDISEIENTFELADRIKNHIETVYGDASGDNLYRIILQGSISPSFSVNLKQLEDILSEAANYIRIMDKTEPDISDTEKIATETSLRGIFAKKMLEKIKNTAESEQQTYKNALKFGLQAFSKGVKLNDN